MTNWRQNPDNVGQGNALISYLQQVYYEKKHILHSKSDEAAKIEEIRTEFGDIEAAAALASMISLNWHPNDYRQFSGVVTLILMQHRIHSKTPNSVRASLRKIANDYREKQKNNFQLTEDWVNSLSDVQDTHLRSIEIGKRWLRRKLFVQTKMMHDEAYIVLENIRNTEKTYKEYMRLAAPVEYWRGKAAEHKKNAEAQMTNLIKYIKLGGSVLLLFLVAAMGLSFVFEGERIIVLAAASVIVSTVAFWVGRVMVRLYLSEHHLAIDADERAVMVETYIALSDKAEVASDDRSIVLGALFRPTEDGIVRDDATPDPTLSGILSRMFDKSR